ncbi:23S rRNA (adenine(2030)-N(6))-methyltransferase RlmJ [Aquicella lusitana]|uniref:Ribosomal RNA large subunit methyltransferase J n=1 Tax=Aquicella lusitana TaxID=254246 RepID=A0A370GYB0_9COXI|nr:23S rRNA (adenine(2030)-N(6))-methyltransferase RlmJ [Aquicella lusitana]RDI48581.1 23S rRNA (adenine2030-N6)-methyltransferase [Aquicella lusitana]VVC74042.1 Ribosomal RNA large subunit methyltransferase J [Aquicella lusitana]
MNYRHLFHAGNFADVVKHVTLVALLASLARKETPFCYIDTHAGTGFYDLSSEFAAKNKEYEGGIEKVIQQDNPPDLIRRYLYCVHQINNKLTSSTFASLRYYPGSPMIARCLARPHDRIIACELQPAEYQALRTAFAGDKQVAIHHMDGFLGLKAFLPPHERRGLVLIDPPYENPDEFTRIAHALPTALKRWETGIYAIWYPIKEKSQVERFYRAIKKDLVLPVLAIEFTIFPDLPNHLNGCGMVVINPPWQFDTVIAETLPWLWKALTINDQGAYRTYPLK